MILSPSTKLGLDVGGGSKHNLRISVCPTSLQLAAFARLAGEKKEPCATSGVLSGIPGVPIYRVPEFVGARKLILSN